MVNPLSQIVKEIIALHLPFTILPFTILTMSFYPSKVSKRFHLPQNVGKTIDANAVGMNAAFVCGTALRFTLKIEPDTKKIIKANFQTSGCGYAIAAADVLAEKITGKYLAELHGLENGILRKEIETELGSFEQNRKHCLELALDALHAAFADFRVAQIEEWTGEKALICTCFGVSEETIERVVESESAETVEEVTEICSAGSGCGSCQPLIQEIIDIYWRENI